MTQSNTSVFPVVTKDHNGALRSTIFASRAGMVATEKLEHDTGLAVKAVVTGLGQGDFVVRSVKAGKRRSFQVLAGSVPFAVASAIPGFAGSIEDNRQSEFVAGNVIVLEDGDSVLDFVGAVRVN